MECTDIKRGEKRGCVQKQETETAYEHVKACQQHACNNAFDNRLQRSILKIVVRKRRFCVYTKNYLRLLTKNSSGQEVKYPSERLQQSIVSLFI